MEKHYCGKQHDRQDSSRDDYGVEHAVISVNYLPKPVRALVLSGGALGSSAAAEAVSWLLDLGFTKERRGLFERGVVVLVRLQRPVRWPDHIRLPCQAAANWCAARAWAVLPIRPHYRTAVFRLQQSR
ncbi:hypothetical protein [Bradyrhizobium lablabi]|uniref:hypothetical protein n=1 Tax=Bradyrhizobium lablabi TaxID=722472 RepID=UPI0012E387A4|nr:hypothetical protein [Bradyrhizobium lablabi]